MFKYKFNLMEMAFMLMYCEKCGEAVDELRLREIDGEELFICEQCAGEDW